jgi:mono/diheme cytochrome c family protein
MGRPGGRAKASLVCTFRVIKFCEVAMKKTSLCIILTAALAWSIIPSWAQTPEATPKAQGAIGQLAQMMQGCPAGRGAVSPQQAAALKSGPDIFNAYCAGCHAGGGNSIVPNLPLKGSAQLNNFNAFRNFVRNPRMPNGATGPMPAFSAGQISNQQMRQLYQFLKSRWGS